MDTTAARTADQAHAEWQAAEDAANDARRAAWRNDTASTRGEAARTRAAADAAREAWHAATDAEWANR